MADAEVALGPRGTRLWESLSAERPSMGAAERVLAEEACRLADRLERLDAILRGEDAGWLSLVSELDGSTARVVVTGVLVEARQQQGALKGVAAELRQCKPAEVSTAKGGSDELAERRAERRKAAGL